MSIYQTPSCRRNGSNAGDGHNRRDRSDRGGGQNHIDHRNQRTVYLSNLPWDLKWKQLKDLIERPENAGKINFLEILEERDGRSKGCAVVEFVDVFDALKCVCNMNEMELSKRVITAEAIHDPVAFFYKLKDDTGIVFNGGGDRPEKKTYGFSAKFLNQLGINTPLRSRVLIKNIPYNCGSGRLFDVCALAGKVTWLDLQLDKEDKSKAMAVVEYSHPIEAVQAVSMLHKQRLLGQTLDVRMDRCQKEIERREPGGLPLGLDGVGKGFGENGASLTDVASVISSIKPINHMNAHMNGNVAAARVASPFVLEASRLQATPVSSHVRVYRNSARAVRPSHSHMGAGSSSSGVGSRTIRIKNLPAHYTEKIVRETVQEFGHLESVEMITTGVAVVRFKRLNDAQTAKITLQGTMSAIDIKYL